MSHWDNVVDSGNSRLTSGAGTDGHYQTFRHSFSDRQNSSNGHFHGTYISLGTVRPNDSLNGNLGSRNMSDYIVGIRAKASFGI